MVDWKKLRDESEDIDEQVVEESEEKEEKNEETENKEQSEKEEPEKEPKENPQLVSKNPVIRVDNLGFDSFLKNYEEKAKEIFDKLEKREEEINKKEQEVENKEQEVNKEVREWEKEKENREKFENLSEKEKQKKVHYELRGLLRDYPLELDFDDDINNYLGLVKNLITIDNLMIYAKYHSTKQEIMDVLEHKQKEIRKKVDLNKLRKLWYGYNNSNKVRALSVKKQIMSEISQNSDELVDLIEYFSLVIPRRDKKSMNIKSAHGLPASKAEEYEEAETEEGKSIGPDTQFKVDPYEGKITPVT